MHDRISTPNRLTVMLPIIRERKPMSISEIASDKEGNLLVQKIMIRKGNTYIKYNNGRLRPVAQAILNKNLIRLKANENPADIVRDMQVQLQLL